LSQPAGFSPPDPGIEDGSFGPKPSRMDPGGAHPRAAARSRILGQSLATKPASVFSS